MTALKKLITRFQPQLIAIAIILIGMIAYLLKEAPLEISQFIKTIEYKTIDARFGFRGPIETSNSVVIAAIDEHSLHAEGKWPWPREKIARLIKKVSNAGATVIAFDVGFFEKDDTRLIDGFNKLKNNISLSTKEKHYLDQLIKDSDNDALLAKTIKQSKTRVVLGYFFNLDKNTRIFETDEEMNAHYENLFSSQHQSVKSASETAEQNAPFLTAVSPKTNIKLISDSAEKSGFFNMVPDSDYVVRSMPIIIRYNDLLYAPLSLKALSAYIGNPISVVIDEACNIEMIKIGEYSIPSDRTGNLSINFKGPTGTFPIIPVTDILNDKVENHILKDKIIVLGATAQGMFDLRATPFGTDFPGCEIHANIIDSVLTKNLLSQPRFFEFWNLLIIFATGLLLGFVLPVTGAVSGLSIYTILTFGYCFFCQYLFTRHGLILNMVYPLTFMSVIYISITAYKYLIESKKKKFISNAFSTYLSPSVVNQLIKSPEKLNLGGEERVITAFFSDVQGFTSISEKLTPKELVDLLNEFLTEMTNIILKYDGTVDKFEGDAIIAFFGAPNDLKDHAKVTCLACIEMQQRLKEMNEFWILEGKPELLMRIGLCSGTAVVGNMGSKNRMDYTMMGDVVNTAARLEGVNKHYGSYTMISDTTKKLAGDIINTREIDTIYLVGKNEPVTIYELIEPEDKMDKNKKLSISYYAKGLELYKKKKWKEAIKVFSKSNSVYPLDGPSRALAKRCKALIQNPPKNDWDVVYKITSK